MTKRNFIISYEKLILILLFLASMNFLGRYFYIFTICFIILCLYELRRIRVRWQTLLLFVIGLCTVFFSPEPWTLTNLIKPFVYAMCSIIGFNIIKDEASLEKKENKIRNTILVMALGAFSHYLLNMIMNRSSVLYRNTMDFWSRAPLGATAQASLGTIALGCVIALIVSSAERKYKITSLIVLVLIMYYNLVLAGRTPLAILLITFSAASINLLINKRKKLTVVKTIAGILLIIGVLVFVYNKNIFNVRTIIQSSSLYERFFARNALMALDKDGRMDYKAIYIQNFGKSLMGGLHIRTSSGGHYAHDLLLDAYDESGIITLAALIALLLGSAKNILSIEINNSVPFETKQLVLCVYIAFFAEFFVEPIFVGFQWFFCVYCIFDAMIADYCLSLRSNRNEAIE